jgi:hypothetical protein
MLVQTNFPSLIINLGGSDFFLLLVFIINAAQYELTSDFIILTTLMQQHFFFTGLVALIFLGMFFCFVGKSIKILEKTTNKLILQIQPTFSWAISIFFGGIALIFTLGTLIIPPLTVLDCRHFSSELASNRPSTSCELVAINWIGKEQNKTSLPRLQRAFLESKLEANSDNELFNGYRIALVSGQDNIPLTTTYISKFQPEYQSLLTILDQINFFIDKSLEDSLMIQQDEKLLSYTGFAMSGCFWAIALILFLSAPYITCSFDREADSVTIERRNFLGKRTFQDKISEITTVEVEEQSGEETTTYRINLLLKSGKQLPLTYCFTSGWQEKQQITNRLKKFLEI